MFSLYWHNLGLPLSQLKGNWIDGISFSLVEALVWIGLVSTLRLVWLVATGPRRHKRFAGYIFGHRPPRLMPWLLAGPGLLLVLAAGQGALPFYLSPTGLRKPLTLRLPAPPVSKTRFEGSVRLVEDLLLREFDREAYFALGDGEALHLCNRELDSLLRDLDLEPGRTLGRLKRLRGLSRVLGLAYGGPAFHDPLTGEAAVADTADLPTSRAWRLHAACHETAHAKGYSREMDAEILTALALLRSPQPALRTAGYLHFLVKSGLPHGLPEALDEERERVRRERQAALDRQPLVRLFSGWLRRAGVVNNPEKYGARPPGAEWNPNHPFFATVLGTLERAGIRGAAP